MFHFTACRRFAVFNRALPVNGVVRNFWKLSRPAVDAIVNGGQVCIALNNLGRLLCTNLVQVSVYFEKGENKCTRLAHLEDSVYCRCLQLCTIATVPFGRNKSTGPFWLILLYPRPHTFIGYFQPSPCLYSVRYCNKNVSASMSFSKNSFAPTCLQVFLPLYGLS